MEQLLDLEAELGSDNEEHDDVVRDIDREKELKEEGLEGLDLDQELQELINNQVDINDDDEQVAYQKFLRDLQKQDKEELQAIISGRYRGAQKRSTTMLEDQLEENELNLRRLKRMEQTMKELEERDNIYDIDEGHAKKKKAGDQLNEEEEEEQRQRIMENALIIKNELKKINKNEIANVDESAFVDINIFTLY